MALDNIPGQDRVKRFLRQLVTSQRIPHAFLFIGMPGIGKKRMALEFAKLLNCLELSIADGPDGALDSCDHCSSCLRLAAEQHPDLHLLKREGAFIKLEQIRALRERFRFSPFEARYRIVIIEDAQDLKAEAGNAMLKLLEEPPRNNVFVLLTPEPQMLLPTIVSRCCNVRFQPLPKEWIVRQLREKHGVSPNLAADLADFAGGSLREAEQWIEQDRLERMREILHRIARLPEMTMIDFFEMTSKWAKENADLAQDLECIKFWLRKLIHGRLCGEREGRRGERVEPSLPEAVGLDAVLELFETLDQALWDLRYFANKQLTLEAVCLRIKDLLHGQGGWYPVPQGR